MSDQYTLVRHSAWVVKRDGCFRLAVEECWLSTKRKVDKVKKVGGFIGTYSEASDLEYNENYPPSNPTMIPRVLGTFSDSKIEGAQIYIPKGE